MNDDHDDPAVGNAGSGNASSDFIASAGERICGRGRQERRWFESWRSDYEDAAAAGDDATCELLLDVLIAFDAVLAQRRPMRLRRVA